MDSGFVGLKFLQYRDLIFKEQSQIRNGSVYLLGMRKEFTNFNDKILIIVLNLVGINDVSLSF